MSRVMTIVPLLVGVVAAGWGAVAFGMHEWRNATEEAVVQLEGAPSARGEPVSPDTRGAPELRANAAPFQRVSPAQFTTLPAPVARYFALVLAPEQRVVQRARIDHEGQFALRPNEWKPFTSHQHYVTAPRGFVWDARIRFLPGVPMMVRDSYLGGRGTMRGALAGIVTLVDQDGTPGLASGALLRYLAEGAWLPTALLPSEGVMWAPIDDSTARASLTDAGITVWMDVHFAPSGAMSRVSAIRERDVDGRSIPTPWEGRYSDDLVSVDGMKIPAVAEVAWLLPEGEHAYWRGRIASASYDYRECASAEPSPGRVSGCS